MPFADLRIIASHDGAAWRATGYDLAVFSALPFEGGKPYHYKESGLGNVWLKNGVILETHPDYGELVSIPNVEALHKAVSRCLIAQPAPLTGAEVRFLRTAADMSRRDLAVRLGIQMQDVAAWEEGVAPPAANQAAEIRLRALFAE